MSRKKQRLFESWKDAETAYEGSAKMAIALDVALHDLVRMKVLWLAGMAPRRIGLCRLASNQPVVILVEREMVGARYLEEWAETVKATPAPSERDYKPEYKEWQDVQTLASTALKMREVALEKAAEAAKGCARTVLPGEVDQNVRSY